MTTGPKEQMKESIPTPQGESIVGHTFADRFTVRELLGTGGMGNVYLAEDRLLAGERVALKILHKDLSLDDRHAQRFLREIRVTRQITHPNVVRTFDVGEHDGQLFFSMELVQGTTLRKILDDGVLTVEQTLPLISQILKALDAIHASQIIHRDLKPSNVLILADGVVKVMDFGVARPARSDLTGQHEVVGSALYMAPEQWVGGDVGPATDYYALGALWYELLTGVTPFESENPATLMYLHLQQAVVPPIEVVPEIPVNISNIIVGLLAKDPVKRSLTVERLRALLAAVETGAEVASSATDLGPNPADGLEDLSLDLDVEPATDRAVSWLEGNAFVPVRAHSPVKLRPVEADTVWKKGLRSAQTLGRRCRVVTRPLTYLVCVIVVLLSQHLLWDLVQQYIGPGEMALSGMTRVFLYTFLAAVAAMLLALTPWMCALYFLTPARPHFRVAVSTGVLGIVLLATMTVGLVSGRAVYSRDKDTELYRHLVSATSDATVAVASAVLGRPHLPSERLEGTYAASVRRDWYLGMSLLVFVTIWIVPLLLIRTGGYFFQRGVEIYASVALLASVVIAMQWKLLPLDDWLWQGFVSDSIVLKIGLAKLPMSAHMIAGTLVWYLTLGCILAIFLGRGRRDIEQN
ncbi:MAG: serine/threonine-protein kinase [Bdellovibrionota bacterium]|nr:MAG: serine/threonine-protein kinase [Bdellovibrionota bacterium]